MYIGVMLVCAVVDSDTELQPHTPLPPGVEQEDLELFTQAQDRAQDALNKVNDKHLRLTFFKCSRHLSYSFSLALVYWTCLKELDYKKSTYLLLIKKHKKHYKAQSNMCKSCTTAK